MSTDLAEVLERLSRLSKDEKQIVLGAVRNLTENSEDEEQVPEPAETEDEAKLRLVRQVLAHLDKTSPFKYEPDPSQPQRIKIPGSYTPTREQTEEHLAAIFSVEQLEAMLQTDISKVTLPPGAKTTAEILSEDREDRF